MYTGNFCSVNFSQSSCKPTQRIVKLMISFLYQLNKEVKFERNSHWVVDTEVTVGLHAKEGAKFKG